MALDESKVRSARGELLAPPSFPNRRIEFLGDSESTGYGVECGSQDEHFSGATENAAVRTGIEDELPPRAPSGDDVEALLAWLLRRATAFEMRHDAGHPKRPHHPSVHVEERFLALLAETVHRFEDQFLLAVAPSGNRTIQLRRRDLLILRLRERLSKTFERERAKSKRRTWEKCDERTWLRLYCFAVSGLPFLTERQRSMVADFELRKTSHPRTLSTEHDAKVLIHKVYGSAVRVQDAAKGKLASLMKTSL